MSFKDAVEKFVNEIKDLSNIEVTTYTGNIEQAVDPQTGQLNWSKFEPTSGTVILAAATQIKPNFNAVNFRASNATIGDMEGLISLHQAAVESAQKGRMALLEFAKSSIPSLNRTLSGS